MSEARGAMRHRLVKALLFEVTHFEERGKLFLFRRGRTSPPIFLSATKTEALERSRAKCGSSRIRADIPTPPPIASGRFFERPEGQWRTSPLGVAPAMLSDAAYG